MSGGGGTTTTTNVSRTELPEWVNNAGKANYDEAVRIGNKPLQQYAGPRVASPSELTEAGYGYLRDGVGTGSADIDRASSIYSRMADPSYFAEGITGYMNPFIDNVESKALGALDESRTKALMSNADKARASKSFGGSRAAIVDGVTNSEAAKEAGILSAGLRRDAFDSASAALRGDMATAASGSLATGAEKQSQWLKNLQAMLSAGSQQQSQAQAVIDADMQKFDEVKNKDIEALNLRSAALGMAPYNTTTTGTSTTPKPGMDPASLILGILSLGMGVV